MNYSDNYILLNNHRNWDNRMVFSKETRSPPLLKLKLLWGHLYPTAQCKARQENTLIGMEFSFSSSCCFGVAFCCCSFFFLLPPQTAFGFLLNHSRLTLLHRLCLLGVGKLRTAAGFQGMKHEPTCLMRLQSWRWGITQGCPLLKLHIKHPKDLGYTRDAVWFFSAVSFCFF